MNCPECNHPQSRVTDTDRVAEGLRRYRICRNCFHRFATLERVELWDNTTGAYCPAEQVKTPALVAVPEIKPAKQEAAARHMPGLNEACLEDVCPQARSLLVQWWNESRRSKHRRNATWTRAAWEASVARVSKLPPSQQIALCEAGVEHGWQALKIDYLQGGRAQPMPSATGRPMPKDPAMLAALEQWPSQTA